MKRKIVKCEYCNVNIPIEPCKLATYQTAINGEEYIFCCQKCGQRFQQKRRNSVH